MNLMIRLGAVLLLGSLVTGTAIAGARDDLDRFTRGLKGLDGQFSQQVYDANGTLKETSSGQVQLSVPRLFRWEYVKPYPQLIVADGSKVWIYDPDLEQVTVREQGEEEQGSPLAALVDPARLDAQFVVTEAGRSNGLEWLALTPRSEESSFRSARLGFNGGSLSEMEVVDAIGQRTRIQFTRWSRNPAFATDTFKYTVPAGVDVIGEG